MKYLLAFSMWVSWLCSPVAAQEKPAAGFVAIYDEQTFTGWHVSVKTGHSHASKNQSGGKWLVEEGAIVGSQDIPGYRNILVKRLDLKN